MKRKILSLLFILILVPTLVFAESWFINVGNGGALQWRITKHASSVFAGATNNAHGSLGEKPIYTIFTVTGDILVKRVIAVINTTLTDAADAGRLEVGVVGNTAAYIAQTACATAGASLCEDGDIWASGTPGVGTIGIGAQDYPINDGANIVETTSGADIQTGQIDYYLIWVPLESGASVVEAGTLS